MRRSVFALAFACALAFSAGASALVLSVQQNNTVVGGATYSRFDVVWWDPVADTSQLLLSNSVFNLDTRVDALQRVPGGDIVFTIAPGTRTIAGLSINDGDVVRYDPVGNVASLLLDESGFSTAAEVDAMQLLPNGHLLLSTEGNEVLFGFSFRDGDIVDYDPVSNSVVLFFSEDLFVANEDLDALWVGSDGAVYLSTRSASTLAGLVFQANDVVRYDPVAGTASLAFDGPGLPNNTVYASALMNEPPRVALLAAGLIGLLAFPALSRRRRARDAARRSAS